MLSKKFVLILVLFLLYAFSRVAFAITEDEAVLFARQAHERASAEKQKENMELSSMYYINALSFRPGNINIITDYTDMISKFAQDGLIDNPVDSLEALENFLNAQVMTVKPDDLPKIVELKDQVYIIRERLLETQPALTVQDDVDVATRLSDYKIRASASKDTQEYLAIMQETNTFLIENGIDDEEIEENLQRGLMTNAGITQINELIAHTSSPDLAPLQMYYLQLAESSLQQIVALSVSLPDGITQEVLQIKTTLDNRLNEIAEEQSKAIFEQIEQEYAELNEANKSGTYQKRINSVNKFMHSLTSKAQGISSMDYNDRLENMVSEIQNAVLSYRVEQENAYNRWAIQQMKNANTNAKKYTGKINDDEDRIGVVMVQSLCSIDTRLLNFGTQQCLTALLGQWYTQLDEKNKQAFDEAMAFRPKRSLDEF